jgi:hypothetical protein
MLSRSVRKPPAGAERAASADALAIPAAGPDTGRSPGPEPYPDPFPDPDGFPEPGEFVAPMLGCVLLSAHRREECGTDAI